MRLATLVVFVLMVSVVAVSAQTPFIAVYFDDSWQHMSSVCPGFGPDSLYIALVNANAFVSGVEFRVIYPTVNGFYLGDFGTQPATVGATDVGISMGWAIPPNGNFAVYVCGVSFFWNCTACVSSNEAITVVPNPATGFLGFTDFPNYTPTPVVGMTSLICPTIAVEETTWGQVKALYGE